jgi:hypothetical protein
MAFKPYPVYDFRSGQVTAVEPWKLPQEAFSEITNGYLRRGILQKRKGHSLFGKMVDVNTGTKASTNPGRAVVGLFAYRSGTTESLIGIDTKRVNLWNATTSLFNDKTYNQLRFKAGPGQNYQIAVGETLKGLTSTKTGKVLGLVINSGTFAGHDASGTILFSNGDFTGAFTDTETLTLTSDPSKIVGVAVGTNSDAELTGDDSNYIWWENWRGIGYFTNNKDILRKYDGSFVTKVFIDLDVEGGPDNDVNACSLLFVMHDRLVLLRTTEGGFECPQRARWSNLLDPLSWQSAAYADAPTDDQIVAADFIGDDLYVAFTRSYWRFSYTGDVTYPFRWEQVDGTEGCFARMSLAAFSDEMIGVGPTHLVGYDTRNAYNVDDRIPDAMLGWNQTAVDYCYSTLLEELEQVWVTYPSMTSDKPDSVLVVNYADNCFSTYSLPVHVMGYTTITNNIILDNYAAGVKLDDLNFSFDDIDLQSGYPTSLAGMRDGNVYLVNSGGDDDGDPIEFRAMSGNWNPFGDTGKQARLGWIDFLVDADSQANFSVACYVNDEPSSYQSKTVDCSGAAAGTARIKVWKRIDVGATADFHRILISNNAADNRPVIHAIVPYFDVAGRTGWAR